MPAQIKVSNYLKVISEVQNTYLITIRNFSEYSPTYLNIASGSEANMTTPCEMEFFNFLWLIWDHYIPLAPT